MAGKPDRQPAGRDSRRCCAVRDRIFHFVPNAHALDWLRIGWVIARQNAPMHHDFYSVTMEWLCDCRMVKPR